METGGTYRQIISLAGDEAGSGKRRYSLAVPGIAA
jgi:hypothetical protein